MLQEKYLTVDALTKYIEKKFDVDPYLRKVYVKGEISNLKQPASGHLYFTLKDESAMLRSVMFLKAATKLAFQPEDGMNVLISGRVGVFMKAGRYQFYAEEMEPDGVGALYVRFEQLKVQLEKEGLFLEQHKKKIPSFPSKIAVVTSATGAAVRDILTTAKRRMPSVEVIVYPTMVQGEKAALAIAQNIARINKRSDIDVIIVGRGGGSLEELWAFNEEEVVRTIYDSDIPVISAVGHETDFSLADFVADIRAATPTAAAELAVPDYRDLENRLVEQKYRLHVLTKRMIEQNDVIFTRFKDRLLQNDPKRYIEQQQEKTDYFAERLENAYSRFILLKKSEFERLKHRFERLTLKQEVLLFKNRLAILENNLKSSVTTVFQNRKSCFLRQVEALEYLSPLALLKRGYSMTEKDGAMVKSVADITVHDEVEVTLYDGKFQAKVLQKEES
ncbi:exodeoxyribonuclease VII large subunit [Listeria sp. PSOL-1]|uniref:exodeoxyribonuclease VII large subunit n=1 Tax=Listeria sp. PSOL-1 TaxID=1844999 RepID=UPI0013D1FA3C|nr:exodeoxyribonuclease VII large subunit [Listeria sp. PSOL-1]